MSEVCDRCGNNGVDRRTLSMRCLYDMSELAVPFEKEVVLLPTEEANIELVKEGASIDLKDISIRIEPSIVRCSEARIDHQFTLRVCKRCRAEWMTAIKDWYHAKPQGTDDDADKPQERESIGTGIFIRKNGINVEITEEEWHQYKREREASEAEWRKIQKEKKNDT